MKKRNKREKSHLHSVSDLTKNFTRGLVGAANSRAYKPKGDDKPVYFKAGMKRALLFAGRELPIQFFDVFLDWTAKQVELVSIGKTRATPTAYSLLSDFYDTDPIDLDRQIAWSLELLKANTAKLLAHELAIQRLEHQALMGQAVEARETVLDIESNFGPSVRLLEAKLAIEQCYFGLESQKRLAEEIRGRKKNRLIGFIAYYISMRNEPSMPLTRFYELTQARVNAMKVGSMREYVSYRLTGKFPTDPDKIARVLRIEESHSIFDLAYTISRFAAHWNFSNCPVEVTRWLPSIAHLLNTIDGNHEDAGVVPCDPTTLARMLYKGDVSIEAAYKQLSRQNDLSRLQTGHLQILGFCTSILRSNFRKHQPPRPLLKILGSHLATKILGLPGVLDAKNEIEKVSVNFSSFTLPASINSNFINPLATWQTTPASSIQHTGLSLSLVVDAGIPELLSPAHYTICQSLRWLNVLERDRSYATLLDFVAFARNISTSVPRAIYLNLQLTLAQVLAERDDDRVLFKLMSDLAVVRGVDHSLLPLENRLRGRKWRQLQKYSGEVYLSIVLTLLSSNESDESLESLKRYALEDFLTECDVSKPSELLYDNLPISRDELIYFYRYVCTQRTMELLPALRGSMALENERQAICTILIKIDKKNASLHNEELVGIIHRSRIAEGIRLVDSSRVHVDADMLRKQLSNLLETDFRRYKSLVSAGIGVSKNIEQVLRGISKAAVDDEWLQVPESEADDLLVQIIQKISESFLNDKLHGLDSYLGRRIRHNSLTGQLRAPLSEEKLITKYDSRTGDYVDNDYWLNELKEIGIEEQGAVGQMLKGFARKFDDVARLLCTKYMHIRSSEFPDGVFELPIESVTYHVLRSSAQTQHTLDDFITICFAAFWAALTPCLSRAQRLVTIQARNTIAQCFGELQAGLADFQRYPGIIDLTAAVSNAQRAISRQIEQIGEWFSRSNQDVSRVHYTLEEAVNISIEACLISHRSRSPVIKTNITGDSVIDAGSLFALADIFWIAIDNACTHAGIAQGVDILIDVKCERNDGAMQVRVINKISPTARTPDNESNINGIRDAIEKRRAQDGLRVEGKSGLKKIGAMVYAAESGKLDFGYRDESSFFVQVDIPMISIETESSNESSLKSEPTNERAFG